MNPLLQLRDAHKAGSGEGTYSVCSANELVLRGAMRHALKRNYTLVIESTSNQVNQLGGYTGMRPQDFADLVARLAREERFPLDKLVLGGDHLGPIPWKNKPEGEAMEGALGMVRAYTLAGYTKLHIDTSMRLGSDDKDAPLDPAVVAARGAKLARAIDDTFAEYKRSHPAALTPALVIGSEVPIPGGSQEHEDAVTPTNPADFRQGVALFRAAFAREGADFSNVIAFVVQPGVEFGDDFVCMYDRAKAQSLTGALKEYPQLVFEGHSTDYQTKERLREMVEDGIAILKVGPALTFGLREALCLLEKIEEALVPAEARSRFTETLLAAMEADGKYWRPYYGGTEAEIEYKKLYSYSDRCRYYLPEAGVKAATEKLLNNLADKTMPAALVSLYFPRQYARMMRGELAPRASALLYDRLGDWFDDYWYATTAKN